MTDFAPLFYVKIQLQNIRRYFNGKFRTYHFACKRGIRAACNYGNVSCKVYQKRNEFLRLINKKDN